MIARAVSAWANRNASPAQVRWINWMVQNGLLDTSLDADRELARLVRKYRDIEQKRLKRPRIIPGDEDVEDGIEQPVLDRGGRCRPARGLLSRLARRTAGYPIEKASPSSYGVSPHSPFSPS